MPRPKSDLKPLIVEFGDDDRAKLDDLAKEYNPPNRSEAIREAIRERHKRLMRKNAKG